ncbi:MAG: RNA polymerase sigma-54 factor [Myxococcales bacterium]|nr:RNA polymerase sigma-54 factor [Myxococcales bacterium]
MSMEIKQQLKILQQLKMTPQLQQAIKLLQLSRMELANLIAQEMVENPVLEEIPDYETANLNEKELQEMGGEPRDKVKEPQQQNDGPTELVEATENMAKADEVANWEAYLENSSSPLPTNHFKGLNDDLPGIEATLTRSEDLVDHLMWQLRLSNFTDDEVLIGIQIIGNLDESGYLAGATVEEIAVESECSVEFAEEVLELIQEFDPIGVGARDLRECLLIQADYYYAHNRVLREVIDKHIPNLEKKRYDLIAKDLGIDMDDVIDAAKIVSTMEPKPGRSYNEVEPQYITPDIYIVKIGDEYVSMVNDDGIPKLKVSNYYKDVLNNGEAKNAKKYIQEKLKNADWLIQSIYRRQRTIKKVTDSIIKFQRDFLDKGINHLKPLVLRDVAEDIGMHESTISRVTTNKYVHTPQGIFELKYFFNSSISKVHGEDIASEAVKTKIKKIIDNENPKKPLSDSKIVKLLREEHNIDIARRTVAKYREMLGILSSTKRKRLF